MIRRLVAAAALAGGIAAYGGTAFAAPPANSHSMRSCALAPAGQASCDAILNTDAKPPAPGTTATPKGYGPADLRLAYNLPSATAGGGQTVAIVDAYNDPYAASDLSVYRKQYGLPDCLTSTGCLTIVNQSGGAQLPKSNGGWAQEESLDLDMVSAICPNCHILLVEASSASYANLGAAVNTAAKMRATEISNSYGGSESSSDTSYDSAYYDHSGVAITASAGDNGYGVEYPAASPYVTAVGGTSLSPASNTRGWTETAWSGSGSGCSQYEPQPSAQKSVSNITSACTKRAVADVSADADPNTGVAVYDSYAYQGYKGWMVFGGTSVASPIIASVYALAGNAASVNYDSYPYSKPSALNDVTSGSNGTCGSPTLCTAVSGWDGPTGLGTPNGTGAF